MLRFLVSIVILSFLASCVSLNGEEVSWADVGNVFTSSQKKEVKAGLEANPLHPMAELVKEDSNMCWGPAHGELYFSFAQLKARESLFGQRGKLKVSDPKFAEISEKIADNADLVIQTELNGWDAKSRQLQKEKDEASQAMEAYPDHKAAYEAGIKELDERLAYIEDLVAQLNAFPKRFVQRTITLQKPDLKKKAEPKKSEPAEAPKEEPKAEPKG
jgi:hypothetical protein